MDIDLAVAPDVVGTLTAIPIADATVDAVWSSHNVEHLYSHEVPSALAEFHRVLCTGGCLLVTMPNLKAVAAYIAEGQMEEPLYQSPAGPIAPLDILYGHRASVARGNTFMAHKTGFVPGSLKNHLKNAGFARGRVWTSEFDLWAQVYKS